MEQRYLRARPFIAGVLFLILGWAFWQWQGALAVPNGGLPNAPSELAGRPYPLFSITGDALGEFNRPLGVAEGPGGTIYVADSGLGLIRVFDPVGAPLGSFGQGEEADGKLAFPVGLAFDDKGRLYVADMERREVVVFNQQRRYLGTFGQGIGKPAGILFKKALFYINDLEAHKVLVLDREGIIAMEIGSGLGNQPGQLAYPNFTWVADDGRVFVGDSNNNRVQVFGPDGQLQQVIRETSAGLPLSLPRGLAQDGLGRLHVVSAWGHQVAVYDGASGKALFSYGGSGELEGQLGLPNGLYISDHRIYVTEVGNKRVQVWAY